MGYQFVFPVPDKSEIGEMIATCQNAAWHSNLLPLGENGQRVTMVYCFQAKVIL